MSKILIVDDELEILEEIHEVITGLGFECICAADTSEAFSMLQQHPDLELVITDLRLPDQSGLRLLQRLSEGEMGDRQLKVLVTSGHADRDDVIQLFRHGAVDFLPKPLHYDHLVVQLQRFFPEHQMT